MNETPPIHHVPRARHAFDVKMHDGAIIHVRQHGVAGAPRLVLSHGNGLAIDGYFPFWGPLRNRYEVVVFDFVSGKCLGAVVRLPGLNGQAVIFFA